MSRSRRVGVLLPIVLANLAPSSFLGSGRDGSLTAQVTPADKPSGSIARRRSPADPFLAKARKAIEAHDLRQAESNLNLALHADPESVEAYLMLGTLEFQSGETTQAIQHYQRALQLRPESFSGHYNLGLAYLRAQKPEDGLRELQRAVALNPRNADAAYNLGLVLLDAGRPREALDQLRRAKSFGPDRPDVAFNIIRAELAAHRIAEARRETDEAAKTLGGDPDWQAAVGRLFLDQGQSRDAAAHLAEALRLRPGSEEIRHPLAAAYLQAQQPQAVLNLIQDPTSAEDHSLRADAELLLVRLSEANQEARRALELEPREPRFLLLNARIAQRMGQQDSAILLLQKASELAPHWQEPYYSLAVSYYFERRYADARHSLDQALALEPRSARSLFLYAASLVNQGKNREGEAYLRRAIQLEPDNARFRFHLGTVLVRENRLFEAQGSFEKSIQLKPNYAPPHYQIGKLLARLNQPGEAVRELEKAIQRDPGLAQAYYQLGRVYAEMGEKAKSADALAKFKQLKNEEADEMREFNEEVGKELGVP